MRHDTFKEGDRIAFTAKFLRDTGQHTTGAADRRGTFLRYDGINDRIGKPNLYARVRWDDQEEIISEGLGDYAESDYCDHIRKNGSLVGCWAIAKVGSIRFSDAGS